MTWFALWQLISGWFSLGIVTGVSAIAFAIFIPPLPWPLNHLIPNPRFVAIVVAVAAFSASGLLAKGFQHGLTVKQIEWDASRAAAKNTVDDAVDRASRDVSGGVRDPFDSQ